MQIISHRHGSVSAAVADSRTCYNSEGCPAFFTNSICRSSFDFKGAKTGAMSYWRQTAGVLANDKLILVAKWERCSHNVP